MSKFSCLRPVIEPLEARIAPALLVNGANLLGGPHSPSTGESSVGGNSVTLVKVISGEAIVWFENGDIDGISFGPNTNLAITGDVLGDIVGNLLPNGRLSDTDNNPLNGEDGGVLLPNTLLGLTTVPLGPEPGNIGNIITGGTVEHVTISGQISGIYAGDGAFHPGNGPTDPASAVISTTLNNGSVTSSLGDLDFNPIAAGVQSTFTFTLPTAKFQPGASIHDLSLTKADQLQVFAGSGNLSPVGKASVGGSIYNVTIQNAFANNDPLVANPSPSYELLAGNGGDGVKGMPGGSISNIVEKSSSGQVLIHAGTGGDGLGGAGGVGGSVTSLDLESNSSQYTVFAGDGGKGTPGGAGGSVTNNSYANNTPGGGVIVASDFTGDNSDDVLVVDQGTGQMVIEQNNNNGASFTPVVQHFNNNDSSMPVTLITAPSGAQEPIAAAAANFFGTQNADLVVAYEGSNSLVVYHNQGGGVFWNDSLNNGAGDYDTQTVSLSFSPSEMTLLDSSADSIALAENVGGHSVIHLVTKTVNPTGVTLMEQSGSESLSAPCVGLVTAADGTVYAALSDGEIDALTVTGLEATPFSVQAGVEHVSGGIANIDIDSTGNHLLALSANGKTLAVFNEGSASTGTSGPLSLAASIDLSSLSAKPQVAHFVKGNEPDRIALLATQPTDSQFDVYDPTLINGVNGSVIDGYTPEKPLVTDNSLRNFAVAQSVDGSLGLAGLQTSLGQFTFDSGFTTTFTNYALPFASKTVTVGAGNGGNGIDLGAKLGHGGAGGNISGINAVAHDVTLTAGAGGMSQAGAGGAGGSFNNPNAFTTAGGVHVAALLIGDEAISVTGGAGGSAMVAGGSQASGGAGGSVNGFSITLNSGGSDLFLTLTGGNGGTGDGGSGGAGGSVTGITATGHDGGIIATAGTGGDAHAGANATSGNGGAGGSIATLSYELTLDTQAAANETTHSALLTAGNGGSSVTGLGGAGGSFQNVTLSMQGANRTYDDTSVVPNLVDALLDSTVTVSFQAGNGGQGTKGGSGGGITNAEYTTIIAQKSASNSVIPPYAVLSLIAGSGGPGTTGNGGNGGSILLSKPISGVTSFDPDATTPLNNLSRTPLVVISGNGGNGATKGGVAGSISGLTAQNAPFEDGSIISTTELLSALVLAGNGGNGANGDGGAGGSISKSLIGVESRVLQEVKTDPKTGNPIFPPIEGGSLIVTAGTGGTGKTAATAKGGAGGAINGGQFGLVSTAAAVGMQILGGAGGPGVAVGGAGGGLTGLQFNIPQSTDVPAVVLIAGDGGAADSGTGAGGKGGSVTSIFEGKDENSAINLIQAGNGGANPLGKGGAGGNDSAIQTVGFIGRPSDGNTPLGVFDFIGSEQFAQGLFSGRGGIGSVSGVNGSIINVIARQIAAMSAAEDPTTQLFAPAAKIANITADLVGYDADRGSGNAGDGVYNDSTGGTASPSQVIPQDGFILGTIVQTPGLDVLHGGLFTA